MTVGCLLAYWGPCSLGCEQTAGLQPATGSGTEEESTINLVTLRHLDVPGNASYPGPCCGRGPLAGRQCWAPVLHALHRLTGLICKTPVTFTHIFLTMEREQTRKEVSVWCPNGHWSDHSQRCAGPWRGPERAAGPPTHEERGAMSLIIHI